VARDQNPNPRRGGPYVIFRRLPGREDNDDVGLDNIPGRGREMGMALLRELEIWDHSLSRFKTTTNPQLGPSRGFSCNDSRSKMGPWDLSSRTAPFNLEHQIIIRPPPSEPARTLFPSCSQFSTITPTSAIFRSAKRSWKRSQVLSSGTWWTVTKLQPTTISQRTGPARSLAGRVSKNGDARPRSTELRSPCGCPWEI
jgi:hypothetical protein